MRYRQRGGILLAAALLLAGLAGWSGPARADSAAHYFPETRHTVSGAFWAYWQSHGGLAQQGYPITEEFQETSPLDQEPYTVQYFERAVFELHPENAPPYNVLLTPLGTLGLQARYPTGAPPGQQVNPAGKLAFAQTSHTVGGGFAAYWQSHGGLAQYGYPLTDEFAETSPVDGKSYTVQYFERAVFEYHPAAPAGFRIMLGLLGREQYHTRYENIPHARSPQWPPAPGLPPPTAPVLFNATFATDDLSAWHSPPVADTDPPTWTMLNAHLQQSGDASGENVDADTVFLAGDAGWKDLLLETQFYLTSGDPVGVVWRAQDQRYYRLEVLPALPNQHWKAALEYVDSGQVTVLASTPPAAYPGYPFGGWVTVAVRAQGAHLQASIDGRPLLDTQDSRLTQGQIGVYAYEDLATAFDNVRVQQLGR